MQDNKARLMMFTVIAARITASVLSLLSTPLAAGPGQGERITRPVIAEQVSHGHRSSCWCTFSNAPTGSRHYSRAARFPIGNDSYPMQVDVRRNDYERKVG